MEDDLTTRNMAAPLIPGLHPRGRPGFVQSEIVALPAASSAWLRRCSGGDLGLLSKRRQLPCREISPIEGLKLMTCMDAISALSAARICVH